MKFDVVIMNPPYKGNLHLNFLQKGISLSCNSGKVLCIHPSTWLFMGNKGNNTQSIYKETKDKISEFDVNLTLFNANKTFNVSMFMPFCITVINKEKKPNGILVEDKIKGLKFTYENIFEVNKFGNYEEYFALLEKISNSANLDNLENHRHSTENGEETIKYEYYVNIATIRGHVSVNNDVNMFSDDFYTFIPKDTKPEKERTKVSYFGFSTENEALNFIKYLKTKFARFSLALIKCNSQLSRGEMKLVPYLDFNIEYNDISIYKLLNLTENEVAFIESIIPEYYGK